MESKLFFGKNNIMNTLINLDDVEQVANKRPTDEEAFITAFVTQKVNSKKKTTATAVKLAADLGLAANFTINPVSIPILPDYEWYVDHVDDTAVYKFIVRSRLQPNDILICFCQAILLEKSEAIICYLAQGECRCLINDGSISRETVLSCLRQEQLWSQKYTVVTRKPFPITQTYNLGCHCSKTGPYPDDPTPFQIFLCSPTTTNIKETLNVPPDLPVYRCWVHTPYTINLCRDTNEPVLVLARQMIACAKFGIQGCVVHVGKQLTLSRDTAMETMKKQIIHCLTEVNKRVKPENRPWLLIETGAGQGTEICCNPTILKKMIEEIQDEMESSTDEKNKATKIGICLDSCHVFAAGFCPLWCLGELGHHVKLIHFNDSEQELGCCVDRHAMAGTGCIGYDTMSVLWQQAKEKNIPCIVE
jgi:endonuclease IV